MARFDFQYIKTNRLGEASPRLVRNSRRNYIVLHAVDFVYLAPAVKAIPVKSLETQLNTQNQKL